MNPQKLNNTISGDLVGFVEHLHFKSRGYNCHVHCARIPGMGRTQKLQNDVEGTGMEENMQHSRKASASRKKPLHQS